MLIKNRKGTIFNSNKMVCIEKGFCEITVILENGYKIQLDTYSNNQDCADDYKKITDMLFRKNTEKYCKVSSDTWIKMEGVIEL